MALVYILTMMTALICFVTLSVDWARVQAAKTELQAAVDACTRYGATGLPYGPATVKSRVAAAALENTVDGSPLVIDTTNDIEFGLWDPSTKTFQVVTGSQQLSATAIRVTARKSRSRNTAVSTSFTGIFGFNSLDLHSTAIATRGRVVTTVTDADACPWLAGMPSGSSVAATGGNPTAATAPNQSPAQVTGLPLIAGSNISFQQVTGTTAYTDSGQYGADGNTGWIVAQDPANGINTTYAPLNSLVGIFLDDRAPNTYAQAPTLDFTSSTSRDFTTLAPQLKQVFFIGDGVNTNGDLQQFTVPAGATRLFIGIMDEKGWWWDNTGSISITTLDSTITLVK